jgi:hypothetical protein
MLLDESLKNESQQLAIHYISYRLNLSFKLVEQEELKPIF